MLKASLHILKECFKMKMVYFSFSLVNSREIDDGTSRYLRVLSQEGCIVVKDTDILRGGKEISLGKCERNRLSTMLEIQFHENAPPNGAAGSMSRHSHQNGCASNDRESDKLNELKDFGWWLQRAHSLPFLPDHRHREVTRSEYRRIRRRLHSFWLSRRDINSPVFVFWYDYPHKQTVLSSTMFRFGRLGK
jgi:hypothetical protein